ncbi:erythromycin esterase family protein [Streptomyces sp. NPDC089919]|uniref:erythromycin esterase family protein n=1 Tax=Streptomyces sp. NPDC089919 TaxID=3155188 RepID=UPI00343ADD17
MTESLRAAARSFSGAAVTARLSPGTRLLGLGEPTHGVEAFLETRNDLFRHLVEHEGYRSIALESDCLAGLVADAYVAGGGSLEEALAGGFSHGLGAAAGNRELLRWMRAANASRAPEDRLRFYGIDGPLEMTGAAGPGGALTALHDYLSPHLDLPCTRAGLVELLGPEERWADPAALMDPARSVGRTAAAARLRVLADDLGSLLTTQAPRLAAATSAEDFWRAGLHARTAAGLLRYHAALAGTSDARLAAVTGLRDAMMADNLDAVVRREAGRGPTLAFAHNAHLQRGESSMRFGGAPLRWWSAGAVLATRLGDRYAFAASAFGSRGADVPPADTLEGLFSRLPYDRSVIDPAALAEALDHPPTPRVPADHTYGSLDPAALHLLDAVVFLKEI